MSYAIVKGIRIDTEKNMVFLKASSNNVCPRTYEWFESKSLSKILEEKGKPGVEKELLEQYWSGNFQPGTENLYCKTVQFFKRHLPYTWGNTGRKDDIGKEKWGEEIKYSHEDLQNDLYKKFLEFKKRDMSAKYCLKFESGFYLRKRKGRYLYYTLDLSHAKQFPSYEDAFLYAEKINLNPKGIVQKI
jgi:hypothetical protein